MIKEYCTDCGAEITNVEDWLLESTPKMWKCRTCFYRIKTDVFPIAPAVGPEDSDSIFEEAA